MHALSRRDLASLAAWSEDNDLLWTCFIGGQSCSEGNSELGGRYSHESPNKRDKLKHAYPTRDSRDHAAPLNLSAATVDGQPKP